MSDTTKAMERALELLSDDCRKVCTGNIFQPFTTVQDALDRLAPFHVLGCQDADEADMDELAESEGGRVLSTRADALRETSLQLAADSMRRVEDVMQRAEALHARTGGISNTVHSTNNSRGSEGGNGTSLSGVKRQRPEEAYIVEKFMLAEAQAKLEQERLKANDLTAAISDDEESAVVETLPAVSAVVPPLPAVIRPANQAVTPPVSQSITTTTTTTITTIPRAVSPGMGAVIPPVRPVVVAGAAQGVAAT